MTEVVATASETVPPVVPPAAPVAARISAKEMILIRVKALLSGADAALADDEAALVAWVKAKL